MASLGSTLTYGILKVTGLLSARDIEVINSLSVSGTIKTTSSQGVGNTTTEHPLQIGPTNSANIRLNGSDIKTINNGSYSVLDLNYDGGDVRVNNKSVLTVGNEGSGNSLDVDTIDGEHASAFANASHSHSYLPTSGGTVTGDLTVNDMSNMNIRNRVGGVRKLINPKGGTYNNPVSNNNGAIRIKLPAKLSSYSMMRMVVDVYEYTTHTSFTVTLGGYLYASPTWINTFAYFKSTSSMKPNDTVRFARDPSNYGVIYIGDVTNTGQYDYSVISVRELIIGYNGDDNAEWDNPLNISYATSYGSDSVKSTVSGKKLDVDTLDGEHASAFANASHSHNEVNGYKITVASSAPSSPATNDIWIDTSG